MLQHYLSSLFQQNEADKLCDIALEEKVRSDFASDAAVIHSLQATSCSSRSRIRVWRSEYNRQLWKVPCTHYSFRYHDGVAVNRNLRPLSADEIAARILSHPLDPRREQYAGTNTKVAAES